MNPDREEDHRRTRRLALGGALQLIRARNRWTVLDAAHHAQLAPMTVRRIEDGLPVRDRSYAALDKLLGLMPGSVKRALADDRVMADFVRATTGEDVVGLGGLEAFAGQTRTNSPRQARAEANPPTELELVNRVIERLTQRAAQTPAIRELVRAAAAALPDLIYPPQEETR